MKYNQFNSKEEQRLLAVIVNDRILSEAVIDARHYNIKSIFEFSFCPHYIYLTELLDKLQIKFYYLYNDFEIMQIILDEYNLTHDDNLSF